MCQQSCLDTTTGEPKFTTWLKIVEGHHVCSISSGRKDELYARNTSKNEKVNEFE